MPGSLELDCKLSSRCRFQPIGLSVDCAFLTACTFGVVKVSSFLHKIGLSATMICSLESPHLAISVVLGANERFTQTYFFSINFLSANNREKLGFGRKIS